MSCDGIAAVYPLERYLIVYAPSARVFDQLSAAPSTSRSSLGALFVEDPVGRLGCRLSLQDSMRERLRKASLTAVTLSDAEITPENVLAALKNARLVHYYGHGKYDWLRPEESGIRMWSRESSDVYLTVGQLTLAQEARNVDLVVLSACATGLTNVLRSQNQGQYVGLPAGFLQSGAKSVIGSLWPVADTSTCALFDRFYEELLGNETPVCPAEALRRAQIWLLRAPQSEKRAVSAHLLGLEPDATEILSDTSAEPGSHPAYWAAFVVVGNGFAPLQRK